jgi:YidC/Oxa1 family membrane protein insertase
VPTLEPGASPTPATSPLAHNLCPAVPKASDPLSLFAWIFTPIFQIIFMALALLYNLVGDIGIAIILVTILIRLLLIPIFRAQIVSQRRMQMLQPELKAISAKYKGNRAKISEEQMKLYKERGYNPAAGCLPALLQLVLLLPMYQVFSQGLSAPDISSMLQVFGNPVIHVVCQSAGNPAVPCINPIIGWLFNTDAHVPQVLFHVFGFGISILAIVSAVLQLVQTRMMQTVSDDPQVKSQQRIFLILPLFSLIYGGLLPAGLFLYWITTTIFSIVQQYLIAGWGGLFPIFGWTPGFAKDHSPRFPIPPMTPRVQTQAAAAGAQPAARRSATDSAAGTIKPARSRARTSRRGRRR